ncbi:MAG: methyltransferase domain-containing protein, partial [Bryobacterales bacterium]|nr:methyltransferase domain-containing protein [Bryobacterales bacterium]
LLIGPGLDWSPRTGLREDSPPQSYQPYALADSLLRLGLAERGGLNIDCIDINPRVVEHIRLFPETERVIRLVYPAGDADWGGYFDSLGQAAGKRDGAAFSVDQAVAQRVRAMRMNVLTERLSESYDLAVATNVLVYFDDKELGLALANIAHSLQPGGYLLHNDLRPAVEEWARHLALPVVHARTVRMDPARPLYDGVVLHVR